LDEVIEEEGRKSDLPEDQTWPAALMNATKKKMKDALRKKKALSSPHGLRRPKGKGNDSTKAYRKRGA